MSAYNIRFLGLMAGAFLPVQAQAIDYIRGPNVDEGALELYYRAEWANDDENKGDKNKQEHIFAVEYGFAEKWALEIEGEFKRAAGDAMDLEEAEVEIKRQLTERGQFWWDVGVQAAYAHVLEKGEADEIAALLLLQNDAGRWRTRLNLELGHAFGVHGEDIELKARGYVRYDWLPWLKPGIEWQGEFGPVDHIPGYDGQEHNLGPGIYGHMPFLERLAGEGKAVEYEIAYLPGISDSAPDHAVRFKLEYKLRF